MTKSQNTKNAQLTEQFNHGLLPDGWYYYKASDGRSDIATEYGLFCIEADNKVKVEVLEKVPSYSEYLALQSDSLAKNKAVEINAELEAENAKLKELLKDTRDSIVKSQLKITPEGFKLITEIVAKIDEVLK